MRKYYGICFANDTTFTQFLCSHFKYHVIGCQGDKNICEYGRLIRHPFLIAHIVIYCYIFFYGYETLTGCK